MLGRIAARAVSLFRLERDRRDSAVRCVDSATGGFVRTGAGGAVSALSARTASCSRKPHRNPPPAAAHAAAMHTVRQLGNAGERSAGNITDHHWNDGPLNRPPLWMLRPATQSCG